MIRSMFNVNDVKLVNLNFSVNEECFDGPITVDSQCKTKYAIAEDKNMAKLKMMISIFKDDEVTPPFTIDMEMEGEFSWDETLDEEQLETFLTVNGSAVLYSYARPIITQITTFSGNPPLILPLENFAEEDDE